MKPRNGRWFGSDGSSKFLSFAAVIAALIEVWLGHFDRAAFLVGLAIWVRQP